MNIKNFRVRFELHDGSYTFVDLKAEGLTRKAVEVWAKDRVKQHDEYYKIDEIYEVTNENQTEK
jgi:hypothetical protein